MGDGVVGKRLDCVIVAVLQDPLQLSSPDDDALVRPAAGEPLPVPGVVHAVDIVLVALQGLDERPVRGVVHQHSLSSSHNQLGPVRSDGDKNVKTNRGG